MSEENNGSWFSQNWKWALPCGCGGCLTSFFVFMVVISGLVILMMQSSDIYEKSLRRARQSPEVVAITGEPVEDGWFTSESIETSGSSGSADIRIPISGPEGEGTLYVKANREDGQWRYSLLTFKSEGGKEVLLSDKAKAVN